MPACSPDIACKPPGHELIAAVIHISRHNQHKRRKEGCKTDATQQKIHRQKLSAPFCEKIQQPRCAKPARYGKHRLVDHGAYMQCREKRQKEHDGKARPCVYAQYSRISQGIACNGLHDAPGKRQTHPTQNSEDDPWNAELRHDYGGSIRVRLKYTVKRSRERNLRVAAVHG